MLYGNSSASCSWRSHSSPIHSIPSSDFVKISLLLWKFKGLKYLKKSLKSPIQPVWMKCSLISRSIYEWGPQNMVLSLSIKEDSDLSESKPSLPFFRLLEDKLCIEDKHKAGMVFEGCRQEKEGWIPLTSQFPWKRYYLLGTYYLTYSINFSTVTLTGPNISVPTLALRQVQRNPYKQNSYVFMVPGTGLGKRDITMSQSVWLAKVFE